MPDTMHPTDEDVDAFIASTRDPESLQTIDDLIRQTLPGIDRTLWRGVLWGGKEQAIVAYGAITQKRPRGKTVDWWLIGLAEQTKHLSLYVNAVEDRKYLGQVYGMRLGKVKTGAASITFASAADLDLEVLAEFVKRAAELEPPNKS